MKDKVSPKLVAQQYRAEVREVVSGLEQPIRLQGFLSEKSPKPSRTYARYTRRGCEDVGIDFRLSTVPRLELEDRIRAANEDPSVHGVIIYYPIFGTGQDRYLKDLIDPSKDVEGLCSHWIQKLYKNVRTVEGEPNRKAVLPCTPLAVLKMLRAGGVPAQDGLPFGGQVVTIFNRSEVVGRPLASMLANDGARVYSFDVDGPILFERVKLSETGVSRAEALAKSDIVITGVPSAGFPLIQAEEISERCVGLNFSTLKNFSEAARDKVRLFIPRVGPVTVAMCLRNTLRLYRNFHQPSLLENE